MTDALTIARPQSIGARVRTLQAEARQLAASEVLRVGHAAQALADDLRDLAEGGDAYPAGVRDLAARLAAELDAKALCLQAIMERRS